MEKCYLETDGHLFRVTRTGVERLKFGAGMMSAGTVSEVVVSQCNSYICTKNSEICGTLLSKYNI